MSTHNQARSETAETIIADARAMLEAAQADAAVTRRLGHAYLARIEALLPQASAAVHTSTAAAHAQFGEYDHVAEIAAQLADVMREIRDAVELDAQPVQVQRAFGRGAVWNPEQPDKLASAAEGLALAIHDHPDVVRHAAIDLQHRHDLVHLAHSLAAVEKSHRGLVTDRGDATLARTHVLDALSAAATHIRLAARLLHRREPDKLAHFVSPIPHHHIDHPSTEAAKATAPAPTATTRS